MKTKLMILFAALIMATTAGCGNDDPEPEIPGGDGIEVPVDAKILVVYFSWGGTTARMAQEIASQTGGTLFRIEPEVPYPTQYTPCTEVALEEKNSNARPAIKDIVPGWEDYDIVFVGCPVWWWTTPMIIHTFCESYDFKDKIVVPFCTYASTYRDETLAEIADSTPDAVHLQGLGLTGSQINEARIRTWLTNIKILK